MVPSPPVKVTATEYAADVHVVVDGEESPEPDRLTVSPVSQAPVIVTPDMASVLAAGDEIVMAGATLSLKKVRESEAEFPAVSVCVTVMTFEPSPAVVVTTTENEPDEHVVDEGEDSPAPERFTVIPDSHVPASVRVDWCVASDAGDEMAIDGAVLSTIAE